MYHYLQNLHLISKYIFESHKTTCVKPNESLFILILEWLSSIPLMFLRYTDYRGHCGTNLDHRQSNESVFMVDYTWLLFVLYYINISNLLDFTHNTSKGD